MSNHPNRSRKSSNPCATPTPNAIIARRESAALTQRASAHLVCTTERAWQYYEAGERRMHGSMWRLFWILTEPLVAANAPQPAEPNPAPKEN